MIFFCAFLLIPKPVPSRCDYECGRIVMSVCQRTECGTAHGAV